MKRIIKIKLKGTIRVQSNNNYNNNSNNNENKKEHHEEITL
jgi:hypothetical protein